MKQIESMSLNDSLLHTSDVTGVSSDAVIWAAYSVYQSYLNHPIPEDGIILKSSFEQKLNDRLKEIRNSKLDPKPIEIKGLSSFLVRKFHKYSVGAALEGSVIGYEGRVRSVANSDRLKLLFNEVISESKNVVLGTVSKTGIVILRSDDNRILVHADNKARSMIRTGRVRLADLLFHDPPYPVEPKPKKEDWIVLDVKSNKKR